MTLFDLPSWENIQWLKLVKQMHIGEMMLQIHHKAAALEMILGVKQTLSSKSEYESLYVPND